MNTKSYIIKIAGGFFILFVLLLTVGTLFPQNASAACIGDWGCSHDIYGSGTKILGTEFTCQGGTCKYNSSYLVKDCADFNGNYCSGDSVVYKTYGTQTVGGEVCCRTSSTSNVENCADRNDTYCETSDEVRRTLWTCGGGSCSQYDTEHVEYCSDNDYEYCDGSDRRDRNYECSGGSCVSSTSFIEDCDNQDGYYCSSSVQKDYRDYDCSVSGGNTSCDYTVTSYTSCVSDYGDRSFCGGSSPSSECESYPEAISLDWNYDDHNYDSSIHGSDGYLYCGATNPPSVRLTWNFDSQTDDNYVEADLEVATDSSYTNKIVDVDGLGSSTTPVNSYTISSNLNFDDTYYWRVRVKDENNNWSDYGSYDWAESTFATDKERCNVDFSYNPDQPYSEEKVEFNNQTTEGAVGITGWQWTFENGDPSSSTEENPSTEFTKDGDNRVILEATDQDGVICSGSKTITAGEELPEWEETDPFN